MKRKTYMESRMKEIQDLKKDYYTFDFKERTYEAHQVMQSILCVEEIGSMMQKHHLEDIVYMNLKKRADQCSNKSDLEDILVKMNLFLSTRYEPLKIYQRKLSTQILLSQKFGIMIEDYCLLRHLLSFKEIEDILLSQRATHALAEIYILEHRYEKARAYIPVLKEIGYLSIYRQDIYDEDAYLYKKLFQPKRRHYFRLSWRPV